MLEGAEEEEEDDMLVTLYALVYVSGLTERCEKAVGPQFVWYNYLQDVLAHAGRFQRRYRMSLVAFNQLVSLLTPVIYGQHANSHISVEVVLHCTLRWLAGGSYDDVAAVACVSVPTFFRYVHVGWLAIVHCDALKIAFPDSHDALSQQCADFGMLSSNGVLQGCAGAVDGWLCRVKRPWASETDNIKSYFSGHYHAFGLNVQAACDHLCRFTALSLRCPGGTNDARAFQLSSLHGISESLPLGIYLVGDNAYVSSERMLTPYSATDGMDTSKDSFNFYLSQLRIRIEQAFGLMVTKWRVLRKPLEVKLANAPLVVHAIMRLHNYCINSRVQEIENIHVETTTEGPRSIGYLPSSTNPTRDNNIRTSILREKIREKMQQEGYTRPLWNVTRNVSRQTRENL